MALVDIILSEDQTEGTKAVISQWLFSEGERVEKNQPILELETDKVMMEIIAPSSGTLTKILLHKDQEVNANTILGKIDSSISGSKKQVKKQQVADKPVTNTITEQENNGTIETSDKISPSVRRLLKQHNLSMAVLTGTGVDNRITSRDVENYLKNPPTTHSLTSSKHIDISNMRRSIAKHMVDSLLHTAPHVTSVFNLDLSRIIQHRKQNKQNFMDRGANLTFTAYFIAASVAAIKHQPLINSQLHTDTIEVFNQINIGIGTDLGDGGLIVPVLKNCENMDLFAIANSLTDLTNRARHQKLKPSDVKDGTFTISNHGVSGSLIATPIIINQPQSAILGIGKMEKRVVVSELDGNDVINIKSMCYVSLTIDHRVLDAHHTKQFLSAFVEALENWQV
jgi:2-oxoglutarate dehydrogenase E2 component (dihydrolipoamide succinyltransferase)